MDQQATVQMLIWELESWFQELVQKISEFSLEEAKYEPTIHSRTLNTLRQWNKKGDEWISVQLLDPISTIEFKVVHLAQCKQMYDEYAFREGILEWKDLECPEWPPCIDFLKQTQKSLVESLQNLTDEQLDDRVLTHWGELWPIKRIISTMIYHDAYHFGQINTLRNLSQLRNADSRFVK
ncbi:MAG: DinB family protein [Candidatus Hodarchaeales archaeon]|jgi:hypothetical protein